MKLSPDVFAAVMATGILSIAARNHHYTWVSDVLGGLAVLALIVLVVLVVILAAAKRRMTPWSMNDAEHTLPLFTFIAACAVLGNRFSSSHPMVLPVLGAIAAFAWLALVVLCVRNLSGRSRVTLRDQVHGAWLLSSVGTSGLAIVAAKLAKSTGRGQWLTAAVAIWVLALAIYIVLAALLAWRAVAERMDKDGFEPDAWILMGSLAIAVVAGHNVYEQSANWLASSVYAVTVLVWGVATLWIPLLAYFSLHRIERRPQLLQFAGAWWTLVFPWGMYSAATYLMATEIHARYLQTVALVVFWDAMVAWVMVTTAGVLRIPSALGSRVVR